MMAVAGVVGRATAHELVYEASWIARAEGISLREALGRSLDAELLAQLPSLDEVLDPIAYLGETDAIVTAALQGWEQVTTAVSQEAGTARP
jgi:3-carboxy-cis,cis-muconate cycloisomerase